MNKRKENMKQEVMQIPNGELEIRQRIKTIRGVQVMLDWDIAELYGVETRSLNQAVKRNKERFPQNFRFQLTKNELSELGLVGTGPVWPSCEHKEIFRFSLCCL